jgi:transposase-like protein
MKDLFSFNQLKKNYGTHEQCLEAIKQLRFPDPITCTKCKTVQKFYPVRGRTAYACNSCGHHIFPLAGTIFEKTSTPLDYWFYAMFLMTKTRSGISAKQLQRELGVTYKTAWRMFKQIRMLMADNGSGSLLEGIVEVDETFVGGKGKNRAHEWTQGIKEKQVVMGMLQREGKVYLRHVQNTGKWTLLKQINDHVDPRATIYTDEWPAYKALPQYGYTHGFVRHKTHNYARGQVHTQNIENVWSHMKRGINGVYRVVSKKYLQAYADEFAFRYNHRKESMFELLLQQIVNVKTLEVEPSV